MKILVLCTGNSCRSQIAEGYLRSFSNDSIEIYSAGIQTHGLNPKAVEIMKEDDIDISHHSSNNISEYEDVSFDYIITVCDHAKETCPFFPNSTNFIHHSFYDPSKHKGTLEEINHEFRKVRDEIKNFSRDFMSGLVNN